MHAVRFNLNLNKTIDKEVIIKKIEESAFLSQTSKFDSNIIFELGRKYGAYGRIFSHAIIVKNNLLINKKNIKGWAFIAQEGNTILSTINAFLKQTNNLEHQFLIELIKNNLLEKEW